MTRPLAATPDDELNALLPGVCLGCRVSFARLYALTSRRLFGIVLGINHDRSDAEDVLQDVYVKVWERCAQFDAGKGSAIHWLAGIARFAAISSLRRRARRPQQRLGAQGESDDPYEGHASIEPEPLELILRARSIEAVRRSLCVLSIEQRESLMLAFHEGLSYAEVAQRMGRPIGTVKSWLRRSFVLLRPVLATHQ